jgi:HK97 gp10 family phage protein
VSAVKIIGMDEVDAVLTQVAPNIARNLMRSTIHNLASQVAKLSKQNAPVGATGRVKSGHKAKRRRAKGNDFASEVHIEGAFYWRFQEYGTKDIPEQPFVRPAYDRVMGNMEQTFREAFGRQLEKQLKKAAKKAAQVTPQ